MTTHKEPVLNWLKNARPYLNISEIARALNIAHSDLSSFLNDIPKVSNGKPYRISKDKQAELEKIALAISFNG
jgi:hypothetical protein